MNSAAPIAGILICLLAAGCAEINRDQAAGPARPATASAPESTPASTPQPATPAPTPLPAATTADRPAVSAPPATPAGEAAPRTPTPPAPRSEPPRAPAPAASPRPAVPAKPPATGAVTPAPAAPAPKPAVTPATPKPAAAPLDLASLEKRLRDTRAIGAFTKLSLKNQVDDLLNKFRAYYKREAKLTLAELRRPYDMLLLKVLSLLQDSDPPLARDIVASREAIWGILADPRKFNEAKLMAGETP